MFKLNFKDFQEKLGDHVEKNKKRLKKVNIFLIRYFKVFVFLVVLFMLAVGSLFLLLPKYNEVKFLLKTSKEEQFEFILSREERLEELQSVISSFERISERDRERVKLMIPERQNEEELFTEISSLVRDNNLNLINMGVSIQERDEEEERRGVDALIASRESSDEDEEEEDYDRSLPSGVERIRVEMTVFGTDYGALKSLLNSLETNLTLMDVVSIDFSPRGNSTNLTLDTYKLSK